MSLRERYGLVQAHAETNAWRTHQHQYGVSFKQGHRSGFWSGAQWVLDTLNGWGDLTEAEAIAELRLGDASVYWPLFREDQRITADCPRDGLVVIDKTGICDRCLYDFSTE